MIATDDATLRVDGADPAREVEWPDRLADRLLGWPALAGVLALVAAQLACWVPHYLTWPWWADHDVFATLAQGWEAGLKPYRDLRCNNFPGTIYLFWAAGKLAGWGRTGAFYALDAGLLVGLGMVLLAWSRRRFGRRLPGAVAFAAAVGYAQSQDYALAAQRDWQAPLLAALGLLAAEAWPGRAGRWAAALAAAAGLAIRPQTVLFWPAIALAVAEGSRRAGGSMRRDLGEFLVALGVGVALAFAPLAWAGVLGDFVRSVRVAAYGGAYNRVTLGSFGAEASKQLLLKDLAVLGGLGLLAGAGTPLARRSAGHWALAWALVLLYRPLSPSPHAYLAHPLALVSTITLGTLVGLVLQVRGLPGTVRLTAVLLLVGSGPLLRPAFANPVMAYQAWPWLRSGADPDVTPMGYRRNTAVRTAGEYHWEDYRRLLAYLREDLGPQTRIANALRYAPALTGPAGRLTAFPAESVAWLYMVNPDDEPAFARALEAADDSVVVWCPAELGLDEMKRQRFELPRVEPVIRRLYEPGPRFGPIEVWMRKARAAGSPRIPADPPEGAPS